MKYQTTSNAAAEASQTALATSKYSSHYEVQRNGLKDGVAREIVIADQSLHQHQEEDDDDN